MPLVKCIYNFLFLVMLQLFLGLKNFGISLKRKTKVVEINLINHEVSNQDLGL